MPGLKSSLAGLETMLGRDEDIDFSDYLNRKPPSFAALTSFAEPENREKSVDVLAAMEKRMYPQAKTQ